MRPRATSSVCRRREAPASVEFAWRVHATLEGWLAKLDAKASILLAFQGGAFIFITTSWGVVTDDLRPVVLAVIGLTMLAIAMALAGTAILPVVGSTRRHRASRTHEWIYFGHLRLWEPTELAGRLHQLSEVDEVRALSAQLVRISRISWRKHRLLQASVTLTLLAMLAMMVAMMLQATAWPWLSHSG